MKSVYIIGPNKRLKGGISTVINQITNSEVINKNYEIEEIVTVENNKIIDYIKAIKKGIQAKKGSVAHIHMASNGSFFRKSIIIRLLMKKCKIIIHIHGGYFYDFYKGSNLAIRKYIKNTLKYADSIVCVSNFLKNGIEKIIGIDTNIEVIYNSIKDQSLSIDLNKKGNILLFMGKLTQYKGIFDLLEAIENIKEQLEKLNWKVYIAGNGDEIKVKEYIKKHKLDNVVVFLGWISGEKKDDILKKSKVLVMPSYIESFGISCVEAMSYGNAILCSNIGGLTEIVTEDVNGELFNPGNIEEIKNKILKVITDKELINKYAINNISRSKDFIEIKMIKKIDELYNIL